jgi:hypothetical protein
MRYALRQLMRAPGFTAVAILSLAIGIAATTAVYSVVHGVLIAPFPYRGADRMVEFQLHTPSGDTGFGVAAHQFQEVQKLDTLDGAMGWISGPPP